MPDKDRLSEFDVRPYGRGVALRHADCGEVVEVWTYTPTLDLLIEQVEDHEC